MASSSNAVKLVTLMTELNGVEWTTLGSYLDVPLVQIQVIQQTYHTQQRCLMEILDWWMKNGEQVTWDHIAVALNNMHRYELGERIVRRYCSQIQTDHGSSGDASGMRQHKVIQVDQDISQWILDLKYDYSKMTFDLSDLIKNYLHRNLFKRKRRTTKFFVTVLTFLEKESHKYDTFDQVYNELVAENDMYHVRTFKVFIQNFFRKRPAYMDAGINLILAYEAKIDEFLHLVTVEQLRDSVHEAVPRGITESRYDHLILVLNEHWSKCELSALKHLLYKVFGVHDTILLDINVSHGSIVIEWKFRNDLRSIIVDLVLNNFGKVLQSDNNIIKLSIGTKVFYEQSSRIIKQNSLLNQYQSLLEEYDSDEDNLKSSMPLQLSSHHEPLSTSSLVPASQPLSYTGHDNDELKSLQQVREILAAKTDLANSHKRPPDSGFSTAMHSAAFESNFFKLEQTGPHRIIHEDKDLHPEPPQVAILKEFQDVLLSERDMFQQQIEQLKTAHQAMQQQFTSELKDMLTFFLSELEKQTEKIANLTRDISEMSNKLVNVDNKPIMSDQLQEIRPTTSQENDSESKLDQETIKSTDNTEPAVVNNSRLKGGGIGGGTGALIGGIVGSIVPGPGTAFGILAGSAIGAAIGATQGTNGSIGKKVGYLMNYKSEKELKKKS